MTTIAKDPPCFGFYSQAIQCRNCGADKRCRAIFVSEGMDILGELADHLIENLPEGTYTDTDRIPDMVDQILNGAKNPGTLTAEQAELLAAMNGPTPSAL